jgi:hypothetical protein
MAAGAGHIANRTVFLCDTTADGKTVRDALIAAGHAVAEVGLSNLLARASIERPSVILIDADADGALDVVTRMRDALPDGDEIHVLLGSSAGGVLATADDIRRHEGSGTYARPIDLPALVRRVGELSDRRSSVAYDETRAEPPTWTAPTGSPVTRTASVPPSLPPPSMRSAASFGSGADAGVSSRQPTPADASPQSPRAGTRSFSPAEVSPELRALLAEAEERIQAPGEYFSSVPSPEDEIEAVLPSELLAALDEPIAEDDAEDEAVGWLRAEGADQTPERALAGAHDTEAPSMRTSPMDPATLDQAHVPTPARRQPLAPFDGAVRPTRTSPSDPEQGPTLPPTDESVFAPHRSRELFPASVDREGVVRVVGRAIANRATGTMTLTAPDSVRRLTFRDGDLVAATSTAAEESLVAFLGLRGDLPRETLRRLGGRFPAFGRHAGAALVARGYLRQDQMWPTLRAHSEWLLGRFFEMPNAQLAVESEFAGRTASDPTAFGGSTGAAVFVDVIRRVISPTEAIARLGGPGARLVAGDALGLLEECALDASDIDRVRASEGGSLGDALVRAPEGALATVLYALVQIGVMGVTVPSDSDAEPSSLGGDKALTDETLDEEAFRERIRARLQLVEEGDYFALLGVPSSATGYEIRRAFLDLRRAFEPARVSTPGLADLDDDLRTIVGVLEEAYEVLKDSARRERYRRAIEMPGG